MSGDGLRGRFTYDDAAFDQVHRHNDELRAEIERLRAALIEVSFFPCVNNDGETEPCECCCLASLTATRALGDDTEETDR